MSATFAALGLDKLSREERLELAHELWDSVEAEASPSTLTEAQKRELDRRADCRSRRCGARCADGGGQCFDQPDAGAEAIRSIGASRGEGNWTTKGSDRDVADDVARLAFLKFAHGKIETAASLKACYVRRSEAEIKLSLGLLGSKIKRSMKPGFAGIDNDLYLDPKTQMLFGDAKEAVAKLVAGVKATS